MEVRIDKVANRVGWIFFAIAGGFSLLGSEQGDLAASIGSAIGIGAVFYLIGYGLAKLRRRKDHIKGNTDKIPL